MLQSPELPDCTYTNPSEPASLVRPSSPTPEHSLYLSNLDDQKFLRFSIKYLYLFRNSIGSDALKRSLARALVHYYPLAGRLRETRDDVGHSKEKLEVDCNGKGALFAEAFMDITALDFLEVSRTPNRSWRKLLVRVEAHSFLDVPPLIVQVTSLRCGGMILCTAINHCICDGAGTSQFLNSWAHLTKSQTFDPPLITPFHSRHVLLPRDPECAIRPHPQFARSACHNYDVMKFLQSQPLVPASFTFTPARLLRLKQQCVPSLKCTAFEALASHTWRSWIRSLDLSPALTVKLLFSVNVRNRLVDPEIPKGYYGNSFVLGCAEAQVKNVVLPNLRHAVTLIQRAKSTLDDDCVRSMVNHLEDKTVKTDLSASLVISQWAKLGLEDLDFGEGKALHMGPISSDVYCLFLPVVGDVNSIRVLVSMPESVIQKFELNMMTMSECSDTDQQYLEQDNCTNRFI